MFADIGFVAMRQLLDEAVGLGDPRRMDELGASGVRRTVGDIVGDRVGE